jgi:hypothetical protein
MHIDMGDITLYCGLLRLRGVYGKLVFCALNHAAADEARINSMNGDWCPNAINLFHHVKSKVEMTLLTRPVQRRVNILDKAKSPSVTRAPAAKAASALPANRPKQSNGALTAPLPE